MRSTPLSDVSRTRCQSPLVADLRTRRVDLNCRGPRLADSAGVVRAPTRLPTGVDAGAGRGLRRELVASMS